jgi:hypothetical protein
MKPGSLAGGLLQKIGGALALRHRLLASHGINHEVPF